MKALNQLYEILSLKRGHGSVGERKFIDNILMPYNPSKFMAPNGEVLAYSLTMGDSNTLWSCHIDTVHDPKDDARQVVMWDRELDMMYKQDGKPLGADDGAGVWLLLQMYEVGVPGTYLFHRGEERGCIGSKGMATHHEDFLRGFSKAIAFDRRDTCSVITRQMGGRCCSDVFGQALANAIMNGHDEYELKLDDTGVFTDTAEYIDIIAECTNVSIGYYNEHGGSEMLDLAYIKWLRDRMCDGNFDNLPVERDPLDVEPSMFSYGWDWRYDAKPKATKATPSWKHDWDDSPMDEYDVIEMRWREVVTWVQKAAPEDVADLIYNMAERIVYDFSAGDKHGRS